jgi:hypothetical protein
MESTKVDRTKLLTITNYAKREGLTRQAVHYQIKEKQLETVKIDGVVFVRI